MKFVTLDGFSFKVHEEFHPQLQSQRESELMLEKVPTENRNENTLQGGRHGQVSSTALDSRPKVNDRRYVERDSSERK